MLQNALEYAIFRQPPIGVARRGGGALIGVARRGGGALIGVVRRGGLSLIHI